MTFIFNGGDKGSSSWLKELNSFYEAMVVICDRVLWYARRLMTGTGPLSTIHNGICCCSTAEVDWRRQEFCLPGWFKSWTWSRVQVLGKEPFPSMKEASAYVHALSIPKANNYYTTEKQEGRRSNDWMKIALGGVIFVPNLNMHKIRFFSG